LTPLVSAVVSEQLLRSAALGEPVAIAMQALQIESRKATTCRVVLQAQMGGMKAADGSYQREIHAVVTSSICPLRRSLLHEHAEIAPRFLAKHCGRDGMQLLWSAR